jgi:serine/threonine protein kinase
MGTAGGGHASLLGSNFGGYEIISLIGRGATGTVYLAHDTALRRYVALKVLLGSLARNPMLVKSFYHEAQAAAPLRHPGIVQVYSAGIEQGTPYIAMEYIAGEPLDRFLHRKGVIHWTSALYIGAQVAESLAYAHGRGVIHRDVKPANIMLDTSGRVHLTDFGIANIAAADSQVPAEGGYIGTPKYMSPEQCVGEEVRAGTDVYSLGITLYQMIAARLPFESDSPVTLIKMITNDEPERLDKINREVPDDVSRLVAYMMQKQQENRPKDAQTVCRIIDRLQVEKGGRSAIPAALAAFIREQSQIPITHKSSGSHSGSAQQNADSSASASSVFAYEPILMPLIKGPVGRFAAFLIVAIMAFIAAFNLGLTPTEAQPLDAEPFEAQFEETGSDTVLARMPARSHRITDLTWVGAEPVVLARLEGLSGTLADGANALIAVQPGLRKALEIRPPIASGVSPRYWTERASARGIAAIPSYLDDRTPLVNSVLVHELIPGTRRNPATVAIRAQRWDEIRPHSEVLHRLPAEVWSSALGDPWRREKSGHVISHPDGRTLCFVLTDPSTGGNYLEEYDIAVRSDERRGVRLTTDGYWIPPESVRYSPSGSRIAYLREAPDGRRELRVVASGGREQDGLPITAPGYLSERFAFSPDSRFIVVSVLNQTANSSELRLINVDEGRIEARLGTGELGAEPWHPTGQFLVATALPEGAPNGDQRAPRKQLWAIDVQPPHNRRMLTRLELGVRGGGSVSRDGRWAATAADSYLNPTLVFVDISTWKQDAAHTPEPTTG